MIHSLGANLYGFIVGGLLFNLELLVLGVFEFVTMRPAVDALAVAPYALVGIGCIFFILVVLYWLSSLLLVFPAFLVFRVMQIPAPLLATLGGTVAGLIVWFILRSPGLGNNMHWGLYSSCLSSAIITGSVTGFMLARIILTTDLPDFTP